ncbi:MAG TPA: metallophosphoesterase family protein [Luteolibacter sp.]
MAGTLGTVVLGTEPGSEKTESGTGKKALIVTPAVVMAPRADGVEVVWAVSRLCRGWVEWREESGQPVKCAVDDFGFVPQGDSVMRVRIDGLHAGRKYEVRAIVESADSAKAREETPWKKFRTLNPAAAESHFVVWNDTHEHHDTLRRLHEVTPAADFLLWNGDTCNNWDQESWLVPTLLHPAGQDVSADRPMLLVWGNHDVRGKWAFKLTGMVATPNGRPYYAFRSGPVAFICLHTGEDKPDNHPSFGGRVAFESLRREQAAWLKEVTAIPEIRDAPHKIVFCHIPLRWKTEKEAVAYDKGEYDRYSRDSRLAWHDALVAWGAQVVISGHTHEQAWIPANEKFPYAQLISGGPKLENARWIDGKADASGLKLVMRDLDGKTTHEASFPRI